MAPMEAATVQSGSSKATCIIRRRRPRSACRPSANSHSSGHSAIGSAKRTTSADWAAFTITHDE
jgi:hypothetical protein